MKNKRKQEALNEFKLRRLIKKAIQLKERKRRKAEAEKLLEEKKLRTIVQHLIQEGDIDADGEPAPYASTAVNALADAFNQVLPVLKAGLRKLSRPEERASYRAHVLEKFTSVFQNFEGLDANALVGESDVEEGEESGLKITLDDDDRIMPSDGKEDARFTAKEKKPEEQLEDDFETFKITDENPTGARMAFETINDSNIEQVMADKRRLLFDPEDKEEYKDYALYNVDLWLLTYEKELADALGQEPAFTETEMQKPAGAQVSAAAAGSEPLEPSMSEEGGTAFDVPELADSEGEGPMEEDLETIFME
jgi:hypothetical protein